MGVFCAPRWVPDRVRQALDTHSPKVWSGTDGAGKIVVLANEKLPKHNGFEMEELNDRLGRPTCRVLFPEKRPVEKMTTVVFPWSRAIKKSERDGRNRYG